MGKHRERVQDVVVIIRRVGCGCVRCELVDLVSMLYGWTPVGFCMLLLEICFKLVFGRSAGSRFLRKNNETYTLEAGNITISLN